MKSTILATLRACVAASALVACTAWGSMGEYYTVGDDLVQLKLPNGTMLGGGGGSSADDAPSSFRVTRYLASFDPDPTFGDHGIELVPIWGYYEIVDALAVQPDGRIVVGGNAADPIGSTDRSCYPASCKYYPALVRLNADGSVDRSFNGGTGKIILAIGDANSGTEVEDAGTLGSIVLQPDGKILVVSVGDGYSSVDQAVARLNADGTLDTSFVGTAQVAREYRPSHEGLWWNAPDASESGWGLTLAEQGDVIAATWFTYDSSGRAWWLSMAAGRTGADTWSGTLYATRGPSYTAAPFDPAQVTRTMVGTGTLTFDGWSSGRLDYVVNGVAGTKPITRQVFSPLPTCETGLQADPAQSVNFQGLWWAAPGGAESGWGIYLAHQGDIVFAAWFTYDVDGAPLWLTATATRTGASSFGGTLVGTHGPAFDAAPFHPDEVTRTAVGTLALTFANGNAATLAYTIGGVSGTKEITREAFGSPRTVCH